MKDAFRAYPGGRIKVLKPLIGIVFSLSSLTILSAGGQDDQPIAQESYQMTVMLIRAVKGEGTSDPKLSVVAGQLNKILPNHRFALIEGKTKRLEHGQSMDLSAEAGNRLEIELLQTDESDGKVVVKVRLLVKDQPPFSSIIRTPPNQMFFLDRKMNDEEHLLVAVGAR